MKRVFVDTGGFVALLVAEDEMHPRASALFETAAQDRWTFVITNTVVVETYSVLLARAKDGRRTAISFLDAVEKDQSQGGLTVERVRPDDAVADEIEVHLMAALWQGGLPETELEHDGVYPVF